MDKVDAFIVNVTLVVTNQTLLFLLHSRFIQFFLIISVLILYVARFHYLPTSDSILFDVFTIEWGLRKLVFRECELDDQVCLSSSFPFEHRSSNPSFTPSSSQEHSPSSLSLQTESPKHLLGAYAKKVSLSLPFFSIYSLIFKRQRVPSTYPKTHST